MKHNNIETVCGVRNVEAANETFGIDYEFVKLDFTLPGTFATSLLHVDRIFLMYPPGNEVKFDLFLEEARKAGIKHITYLSVKDTQFMPFIHHFKAEKLIKKSGISYTFIRAGYFMQNLTDFLHKEIKERKRIYVPAGKGKTSFIDTRDIAEVIALTLIDPEKYQNKSYVITGSEALNFYDVAQIMTEVLGVKITYTDPTVKEFLGFMRENGEDEAMAKVVVGVHFPTKLGLAKGIKYDFEKVTGSKPRKIRQFVTDYKEDWL